MAHPDPEPRPVLTPSRLALLRELTRALAEALLQGDLSRAQWLLAQRQKALFRVEWGGPENEELGREMAALYEMERELLEFCSTWQAVVKERLAALAGHRRLQAGYQATNPPVRFIEIKE